MPIDPVSPVNASREELVRVKAFEIYEQRGREKGREIEHWLAAEHEVSIVQLSDHERKAS